MRIGLRRTCRGHAGRVVGAVLLALFAWMSSAAGFALTAVAAPLRATTARQVHEMPPEQADRAVPVDLTAIVTYYDPGSNLLFVTDASGSVFVWISRAYPLQVGDEVRVQGVTQRSLRPMVTDVSGIKVLSSGHQLPVQPANYRELMTGEVDCRLVSIQGTIRSASYEANGSETEAQLEVLTHGGIVHAYVRDPRGLNLAGLIDADTELSGVAGAEFNARFQVMRPELFVDSAKRVRVVHTPKVGPLALPLTDIDHVMAAHVVVNESQRVRVRGAVTAYDPGYSLVVEQQGRSILALTGQSDALRLGAVVDVIGFPDDHAYSAVLENAQFYATGRVEPVVPRPASYAEALSGVDSDALISMRGFVLSELRGEVSDTVVVMVDRHPVSVVLRHHGSATALPELPAGALVQVSGICRVTPGISWRRALLFRLDMRTGGDLQVLALPSWWNMRHLLMLGIALLASCFVVSLWVLVLRRRVAGQTRQIARAIRAERERSRLLEQINSSVPLEAVLQDICRSVERLIPETCCAWRLYASELDRVQATAPSEVHLRTVLHRSVLSDSRGTQIGSFTVESASPRKQNAEAEEVMAAGAALVNLAVNQRQMYDELNYHSSHDQLTALPNRRLADMRLEEVLVDAKTAGRRVGVAYIDVNHFKQVNDQHGHKVGDLYLQQIAARLSTRIRAADMLARIGGDEFLLIAPALNSRDDGEAYQRRLCACFQDPFTLDGVEMNGSASIGIAIYPDHGASAEALKRYADAEMYAAKHRAHRDEDGSTPERRGAEMFSAADLRAALEASQFQLYYQPQFSSQGQLRGLEALIRLNDPILGVVAPDAFIEVAERSEEIFPIGRWVLQQALEDAVEWQLGVHDQARMVVNVSARQVEQPHFAEEVALALAQSGVAPSTLELEITERAVISDYGHAALQLTALRALGVHISIDDFGMEHSCLGVLHRLPVDTLKIDRSFVRAIESEPGVLRVIEAIVCLARSLGKGIVAEGIESERELNTLMAFGAMDFQGYLFSRPLPATAIATHLARWRQGATQFEQEYSQNQEPAGSAQHSVPAPLLQGFGLEQHSIAVAGDL